MKYVILALAFAALPASAAEFNGTWRLAGRVADVDIDRVCTIRQVDNKIQGPCRNQSGETILRGEVNASQVTWKYESTYQGVTVVLVFSGAFESDSRVKGTITASDTAGNNATTGSFIANRQ